MGQKKVKKKEALTKRLSAFLGGGAVRGLKKGQSNKIQANNNARTGGKKKKRTTDNSMNRGEKEKKRKDNTESSRAANHAHQTSEKS